MKKYYDGQGHVTNAVDAEGRQTVYQYDAHNNLTNMIDALGRAWSTTYNSDHLPIEQRDPLGNVTRHEYDAKYQRTKTIDALNGETTWTYYPNGLVHTVTDPKGNQTVFTYDNQGNMLTQTRTDGGTVRMNYNAVGDMIQLIDPNNQSTTLEYDKLRQKTKETDAQGKFVTNEYNGAGQLVKTTDRRGNATQMYYNKAYKVDRVVYPDGGVVSNRYDALDRLVAYYDALGRITSNRYDKAGRVTNTIDALGNVTVLRYNRNGQVVSATDALGNTVSNVYDALGRVVTELDPLGNPVVTHYDPAGRVTNVVDKAGRSTTFTYDALGRKTTVKRPGNIIEAYQYDAVGNLLAFINGEGQRMTFAYDGMNRTTSQTNALGHVKYFTYDAAGNLRYRRDEQNRITEYQYDTLNRLKKIIYPDATTVVYGYDPAGNRTNVTDRWGTTAFTYDSMGRLATFNDAHLPASPWARLKYVYDPNSNRKEIQYSTGANTYATWTAASFDPVNRMTNTLNGSVVFGYDAVHRLTGISFAGGDLDQYSHDPNSMITRYTFKTNGQPYVDHEIERNAQGFKTTEQIHVGLEPVRNVSVAQTRTHNTADELRQITEKTAPDAPDEILLDYQYDACGNLTNALTAAGPVAYAYDYENRLISVRTTNDTIAYRYDGLGNRIARIHNGTTNYYVNDLSASLQNPLFELDAAGNRVTAWYWESGRLLGYTRYQGTTTNTTWVHLDEMGSVVALTENGTVSAQYAYTPYGEIANQSGTADNPYLWIGGHGVYRENNTLYHMKNRYYDAALKRFISTDPIGLQGGPNLYGYADGNPAAFVDPLGLWGEIIHYGSDEWGGTMQWVQDANVGLTERQARLIAEADNAVDSGSTGPMPWQDQSRHFNTSSGGASGTDSDTRIQHAEESLARAIQHQQRSIELSQKNSLLSAREENAALRELGTGLHSLQDVYAHVDKAVTEDAGVYNHLRVMSCDNPAVNFTGYGDAKKETINYVKRFQNAVKGPQK